jgi:hypothetical protein
VLTAEIKQTAAGRSAVVDWYIWWRPFIPAGGGDRSSRPAWIDLLALRRRGEMEH